ncbi:cobyric acid synthase [Phenylobacterium sp.]|uniref:cobyric acid synthase n=1 Tax=Phenylobacterium sp. TaxID=1871053 RepID=UPI00272F90FF|nr:cobyric acid synthase [Phenylobacterium sp.]MDP1619252.1 cobyric acid synthase [Phenylobacterium sp.]MDP1989124.1 cobyric acid synthase [Phenylobacterium sp.]
MAALMIQGCGSDVGKSVLVAGLCRLFANRGYRVRPFKPQNMSNNAAVTEPDDQGRRGEIGRAQALQAIACRTPLTVHMNPVLLKPQSDVGAQLVVRGQVEASYQALDYQARKAALLSVVLDSFRRLEAEADLVIVEGAGSPAEINLRQGDIANMGFALAADVPVVLVGDIDRGHVIAALVGAKAVLDAADAGAIRGFIINKFRGDPRLFDDGRREISNRTSWPDMGLVPWLAAARRLPAEDAVVLSDAAGPGRRQVKVAVPILRHIANFDDFDPLQAEPAVDLVYVPPGQALPGDADLIILPGSKATLADLAFVRDQGWDIDLKAHVRRGGRVLGVCGGFQMLGRTVTDPGGIEGPAGSAEGLGLLDIDTVLSGDKVLEPCRGTTILGDGAYEGFEMHMGRTTGEGLTRPLLRRHDGAGEGAVSADGRVAGCYVHRLFDSGPARAAFLAQLGAASAGADHRLAVDTALDEIAAALELHLDIAALARLAGLKDHST